MLFRSLLQELLGKERQQTAGVTLCAFILPRIDETRREFRAFLVYVGDRRCSLLRRRESRVGRVGTGLSVSVSLYNSVMRMLPLVQIAVVSPQRRRVSPSF